MAYAEAADVESRLGRTLDLSETTIVETRLGDAELLIRARIPDLDDRTALPTTDPNHLNKAIVVMLEAEMILRLFRNPEGFTQETDGNYSYMIASNVASGRLEVLDEEWDLLRPAGGSGMFVLSPHVDTSGLVEGAYDPSKGMPPWYYDFYWGGENHQL